MNFEEGTPSRKSWGFVTQVFSWLFVFRSCYLFPAKFSTYIAGRYEREFCVGFFKVKSLLREIRGSVCLRLGCFSPAEFILIEIASLLNDWYTNRRDWPLSLCSVLSVWHGNGQSLTFERARRSGRVMQIVVCILEWIKDLSFTLSY